MFRVVLLADIVVVMQRAFSKYKLKRQQQQQQRRRHLWINMQNYQKKKEKSAELDINNHEGQVGPMTSKPWEYIRSYDMEDINLSNYILK